MPTPEHESITRWFDELERGDREAAQRLWERYFQPLVAAARKRLGTASRRDADEEDIAISVFASLCLRKERGAFAHVADREELWRILLMLTNQKVMDRHRRCLAGKRGGGRVRGESAFDDSDSVAGQAGGIAQAVAHDPAPEFAAQLDESFQHLLSLLRDDKSRRVAVMRMERYSEAEIAAKLDITERSVRRKLQLIRKTWQQEFGDD